jgi:amino acid transporter
MQSSSTKNLKRTYKYGIIIGVDKCGYTYFLYLIQLTYDFAES